MNHILDYIGLYVIEDGKKYVCKRIFSGNGKPNYYPPADKNQVYKDMYIDEILFFPIELETFETDRTHKFYGFRYLINSSGHSTLSLGPDPLKLGVTKIQLTAEVQRFRYYINDQSEIVIDKACNSLYPPYILNIEAKSSEIGHTLQQVVQNLVTMYNDFYIDRQI